MSEEIPEFSICVRHFFICRHGERRCSTQLSESPDHPACLHVAVLFKRIRGRVTVATESPSTCKSIIPAVHAVGHSAAQQNVSAQYYSAEDMQLQDKGGRHLRSGCCFGIRSHL